MATPEKGFTPIRLVTSQVLSSISEKSELASKSEFRCEICSDTGFVPAAHGVTFCECKAKRVVGARLAAIPENFRSARLATLTAQRHASQAEAIKEIRSNPYGNYAFLGKPGAGKTHLFWAIFETAARDAQSRVFAGTLESLLEDHRKAIKLSRADEIYIPKLTVEELAQNTIKYRVFLDDIDKIKATEYAGVQVFQILNAIQDHGHQLVWTSNLNAVKLGRFFEQADERFSAAITRRLFENVRHFEMF